MSEEDVKEIMLGRYVGQPNFTYSVMFYDEDPNSKNCVAAMNTSERRFVFYDGEEEIGWLGWADGALVFDGRVEESAKGLFVALQAIWKSWGPK